MSNGRIAALLASLCLAAGGQVLVPASAGAETNMGDNCSEAIVPIDCFVPDDDGSGDTSSSDGADSDPDSGDETDPGLGDSGDSGDSGTSGASGSGGITYVRGISPNPKDYGGLPHNSDGGDWGDDGNGDDDNGDDGDSGDTNVDGGGINWDDLDKADGSEAHPYPNQPSPGTPCYDLWIAWNRAARAKYDSEEHAAALQEYMQCVAHSRANTTSARTDPRAHRLSRRGGRPLKTSRNARKRHVSHGGGSIR